MSKGWDVSRLPTGLLFIPWLNVSVESHDDDGWEKLLTRPPELSGNLTTRDIWERVGGMYEGVTISHICIFDSLLQRIFNMPQSLTTWDLRLQVPSEGMCPVDSYGP
jgi:hypothetical protein